jgi:hypothetical protein
MAQKRHSVDQIISKLRRADVELGKGKKVPEICKTLDISDQTYYRWYQNYRGAFKSEILFNFSSAFNACFAIEVVLS